MAACSRRSPVHSSSQWAQRQARRRHGSGNRYLDNLYEPFRLGVELDGSAAHPAEGRWRDTHRDNANLAQAGEPASRANLVNNA